MKRICIFIASSGELDTERNEVHRAFDELNNIVPHLDLKPVKWETDTAGGLSLTGRIQNEINEKLFDSHIVIGLFHTKVGSYTKEEMDIAFERRIKTFAYFKTDGTTYSEIEDYKQHIKNQQVLTKDYETVEGLKNLWWHNLLLYLVETYPHDSNTSYLNTSVNYNIKQLVGRREALQDMRRNLDRRNALLLLNGMGGVGKTTLARAFINTYLPTYKHIIYTSVQDGFINALRLDFSLHKELKIAIEKEDDDEEVFTRVVRNIQNIEGPNLWVIDNAKEDLTKYYNRLPSQPNWQVLITSRESIDGVPQQYLGVLTQEEAFELFIRHYEVEVEAGQKALVHEITEAVGYHTLTVELLGKLAKKKYAGKLHELQEALAAKGISLDNKIKLKANESSIEDKNTALINIVVQLFALDQLSNEGTLLLKYWSLLPATDIPQDDLAELIPWDDKDDLINVRDALLEKGWLQSTEPGQYRCHQIIQEAVLQQYPIDSWDDLLEKYLWHIKDTIKIDEYKDNPAHKFKWAIYGKSVVNKLKGVKSKALIRLSDQLANIYEYMGRYRESAELLKHIIEDAEKAYEATDTIHAMLQNNLAAVLQDLGDYEGAKGLLEKALASDIKHYGASYPTVAVSQSNLALVLQALGDYLDAKGLLEKALDSAIKHYGASHPRVAVSQSNLANVLSDLGNYVGAKGLLEKALASDINHYGASHPTVAIRQSNLALVLQDLGDYVGAKGLLEKALASDIKHYGASHPRVAVSQSNLANVLRDLGDYVGAKGLLEKALASAESHYGASHPRVATRANNLAYVYYDMSEKEEALGYFEKAYAIFTQALGDEHPHTKQVLGDLEIVRGELGKA